MKLTGSSDQQQGLREWSRMMVKQFQDGGRPPFWKSIYRHISVNNHPIFMKFCTQQQILNWVNDTWSKMKKLHWTVSEFDRTYFLFKIFWFIVSLRLMLYVYKDDDREHRIKTGDKNWTMYLEVKAGTPTKFASNIAIFYIRYRNYSHTHEVIRSTP